MTPWMMRSVPSSRPKPPIDVSTIPRTAPALPHPHDGAASPNCSVRGRTRERSSYERPFRRDEATSGPSGLVAFATALAIVDCDR